MDYKMFFIGKGYCEKDSISYYDPEYSNSYSNKSFYSYPFDDLRNMTEGKDICTLFDNFNLNSNVSLNNIRLYYGSMIDLSNSIIYKDKICGIMGLKLHKMQDSFYNNFKNLYETLKDNNITNYTTWTIEFFKDEEKAKNKNYDGILILGANKTYFSSRKNIEEENIKWFYSSYVSNVLEWMLSFSNIYYYNSTKGKVDMSTFLKSEINFDLDYYFCSKQYFENIKDYFFQPYISKGICQVGRLKEFYLRYKYIYCKSDIKNEISKFPTIYFFHRGYDETFELTYKDLFKEVGNKILFLFFYDPWNPDLFKFGKNFLKKYQLEYDKNNIGVLSTPSGGKNVTPHNTDAISGGEEKSGVDAKQIIWMIVLGVLFVGIVIGVFIGKKLWDKNRKKRANELSDEYEYKEKNDKEEDNKDNDIINPDE